MKKTVLLIFIPIMLILFSVYGLLVTENTNKRAVKRENREYEYYLNKTVYGTDVASLINKAVSQNEKNNIQKNEKGYYIENEENSLKIQIKMITTEKIYQMEAIYNNDITKFVQNFNLIKFKCTNIEYHKKTGKVSKITFEQMEY